MEFEFSLQARVVDAQTLFSSAMARAQRAGLTELDALKLLKPDGREIDVNACLVEMLDPAILPGCEIENSVATLLTFRVVAEVSCENDAPTL